MTSFFIVVAMATLNGFLGRARGVIRPVSDSVCSATFLKAPTSLTVGDSAGYIEAPASGLLQTGLVLLGAPTWFYDATFSNAEMAAGVWRDRGTDRFRRVELPDTTYGAPLGATASPQRMDVVWGDTDVKSGHQPMLVDRIRAASFDGRVWSSPVTVASGHSLMPQGGAGMSSTAGASATFVIGGTVGNGRGGGGAVLVVRRSVTGWTSQWVSIGAGSGTPPLVGVSERADHGLTIFFVGSPTTHLDAPWGVYCVESDSSGTTWGEPRMLADVGADSSLFHFHVAQSASGATHVFWLDSRATEATSSRVTHLWRPAADTTWNREAISSSTVKWKALSLTQTRAPGGLGVLTTDAGLPEFFAFADGAAVHVRHAGDVPPQTVTAFAILGSVKLGFELLYGVLTHSPTHTGSGEREVPVTHIAPVAVNCIRSSR